MNSTLTGRFFTVLLVGLCGVWLSAEVRAQQDADAELLLQTAIHTQLVDGDLDGAIRLYQEILSTYSGERAIAADALLKMGQSYEKLGQASVGSAREAYERLLRVYADQAEPVTVARARLAALEVEPTLPSPTMTVRELMRGGEHVPDPTHDPEFAISSDGRLLVHTDGNNRAAQEIALTIRNLATGEARNVPGTGWKDGEDWISEWFSNPVLSPDETQMVYVNYGNRFGLNPSRVGPRIYVDALDGDDRELVYDSPEVRNMWTMDWSPDGEHILISSDADDQSVFLATLSLESKTLQRLVTLDWAHPRRAEYSPDGRFIAYDSTKGGDRKIYLLSADGAQEQVLVDSAGEDDSPLWTRDGRFGRFLLFRSSRAGRWDLYAVRMTNGRPAGREVLIKSNLGALTRLRGVSTDGTLFVHEQFGGTDVAISESVKTRSETVTARILPKVGTTENKRLTFAPGQRVMYTAGSEREPRGRRIHITDLEGRVLQEVPLESRDNRAGIALSSPDGTKLVLYVYEDNRPRIKVLSADTGTLLNVLDPFENGSGGPIGWSGDSRRLYLVGRTMADDPTLALIDVETGQVVESTPLPPGASVVLSPSKEYLAMMVPGPLGDGPPQVVLRSLEDGSDKVLIDQADQALTNRAPIWASRVVWDFDSRHLLYRRVGGDRLYSFSLETEEETLLVEDMQGFDILSVSPDGKHWALRKLAREQSLIWVLENFLPEEPASPKGNEQGVRR